MALTHAQLANASQNDDALARMRGAMLRLAGYVLNGDPATSDDGLRTARLLWARAYVAKSDSAQFIVDSSARWLRYAAGTSGTIWNATVADLSDLSDADFDGLCGVIASDLSLLETLEVVAVRP